MRPAEWIAHDPDPTTAAELSTCSAAELAARFDNPLHFGTAGLRGPVRAGPDAMNLAVVLRASWAVAAVFGATNRPDDPDELLAIVGYDARHGSAPFANATAETISAAGFSVVLMPTMAPTPVLAFATRRSGARVGIQITASHNPAADNGYKVYCAGGVQINSPVDGAVEDAMVQAPPADQIARRPVPRNALRGAEFIDAYVDRAAAVRRGRGGIRVALTPLHGVGGELAVRTLNQAGVTDVHCVASQFDPDPDFPTVAFPNPEEPGATDAVLALAAEVGADVAIALDPDADRCAVGIRDSAGWRMLSGDETGWLLGDYILSHTEDPRSAVVASTLVSSRMLAAIAAGYGATHVETRTGFKWLARADEGRPGTLVYAYEEAIGHCVDPVAVRDKDGISAAVLVCDLVSTLAGDGRSITDMLDDLARRHGVHQVAAVSRRFSEMAEVSAAYRAMRDAPPAVLGDFPATVTDLTDAVIITAGAADTTARVVVRASGTEPKLKFYLEVRCGDTTDLAAARRRAHALLTRLAAQFTEC